jgi:hypothetical protein
MAALSNDHRLWAPMQVQALVFGEPGTARFVDLTPKYDNLNGPGAPLSVKLRPKLEADQTPPFLSPPKGIHLHWTLPAAFTHVRPSGDNKGSTLPPAPNRWLVMRLWEAKPGVLSQQSWVVESDFTHPDDADAPWLQEREDQGGKVHVEITRVGRKKPLEGWTERGETNGSPPFTAFAPGNLGFAAFYPSCQHVFGLHDPADDLSDGTVCTYLVAGWFSNKKADPLWVDIARPGEEGLGPEKRWPLRMQQNQWSIPNDSEFLPTAVTCYGSAPGIVWRPNEGCSTAHLQDVRVALGGSIVEALAALAKANGAEDDRDRLVSELQLAALAERRPTRRDMEDPQFFKTLGQMLGGRAKLHERAFSARDGGTFWEIAAPLKERESKDANAQPLPELPTEVSEQLAELNRLQRESEQAARALDASRSRLFAAWSRQQFWSKDATPPSAAQITRMADDLEAARKEVEEGDPNLGNLRDLRDAAERRLRNQIVPKQPKEKPEFELLARASPRFWQASDPFVLTAGLPVPALQGGASPLECRVSGRAIAGIKVVNVPNHGTVEVSRDHLKSYLHSQNLPPPARDGMAPDWAELLLDAVFTDRQRAGLLARVYLEKVRRIGNPSTGQIKEVGDAIEKTLEGVNRGDAGDLGSLLLADAGKPALREHALRSLLSAVRQPSTPIRPVYMVWKASWSSHFPDPGRLASDRWELAEGVDCRWKGSAPPDGGESRVIEGFAPITTGLERGFEAARRKKFEGDAVAKQKFEQDYGFAFEGLARLAGQSLMGLTDALAGRAPGPHLGPLTKDDDGNLSVDPIARLVKNQYAAAPLLGVDGGPSFSPLRGGRFELTRLWIVDSFGRIQRLIDTEGEKPAKPVLSHILAGARRDGSAHLLPRLVQPARLLLRWLSARDDMRESLGDLGASPICGFVLHNRVDRSLMIYDACDAAENSVATLLGAVQAINLPQGQEEVRWTKMPARPFDANSASGRGPDEADIPDKTLRDFVNGLLFTADGAAARLPPGAGLAGDVTPRRWPRSGTAFKAFRDLLDRHEDEADLSLDQGLQSVLVGRPLALVRASLRLEFDGSPVADPSALPGLAADQQDPWFRGLTFPVRLGDRRLGPDGLVGYFIDDDSPGAYETLRLRADETFDPEFEANAYFGSPTLKVPCDPKAKPLILTLLLDPKRGVNLVSGILPASVAAIPQALLAKSVSDLEIPFLVAPILGERAGAEEPATQRRIPLPTDGHGEWSWVFFPDETNESEEAEAVTDTAATPSLSAAMALHEGWLKLRPAKGEKR